MASSLRILYAHGFGQIPSKTGSGLQFRRFGVDLGSMLEPFGFPFGGLVAIFVGNVCSVEFLLDSCLFWVPAGGHRGKRLFTVARATRRCI